MPQNPYEARPSRPLPVRAKLDGRPLRILASVPRYIPEHNAGAEATLHAILRHLVTLGWEATVASTEHRGNEYHWDGVKVIGAPRDNDLGHLWAWADVGMTHLHGTRSAVGWARKGRPLVHLVHNHTQLTTQRVPVSGAALVVWNSQWIADEWAGRAPWPSMVVYPPVEPAEYATVNPDRFACGRVTLSNLTAVKGGELFWKLVARRPDLLFLGVEGAYYIQEIPERMPANARVIENQVDVVPVYEQTRVMLVPSRYESFGRVAVEAMASGIPVIAARTPGLVEALTSPLAGECALFADADDEDAWVDALAQLDDPATYNRFVGLSCARSAELAVTTRAQVAELVAVLERLAGVDQAVEVPA